MTKDELITQVNNLTDQLRALGGADKTYIFSQFFKPIPIEIPTKLGVLMNFPSWNDFSEEQVQGFKKIVNDNSDLLTGYVRIGDSVYKAEADHEYKVMPSRAGREIIKALVSRAVKVLRFDTSMLNPKWLEGTSEGEPEFNTPTQEAVQEAIDTHIVTDDAESAVNTAIKMLTSMFGNVTYDQSTIIDMIEMISHSPAPYEVDNYKDEGVSVLSADNTGIALFNDDGKLYWEF